MLMLARAPTSAPMSTRAPVVNCPTCGAPLEWSSQYPYRPFCGERCKLIDLGAWLKEERRIPGDSAAPQDPPDEDP